MSDQNKNKTSISSYLNNQKLFQKDSSKYGKASMINALEQNKKTQPGTHSAHKYKYNFLKDLKKQSEQRQSQEKSTERWKTPQRKFQKEGSPIKHEASISKINVQNKNDSSHLAWQSQLVKSSRKYFDSCRGQAHDYLAKLEGILASDYNLIQKTIQQIRDYVYQNNQTQAQRLKEDLYLAVDEAVEKWRLEEARKAEARQIDYIGELFELSTQIEERSKQMNEYKIQLQDERIWKQRASDLLTTSYQEDILDLSKLCEKSVIHAKQGAEKITTVHSNTLTGKFIEFGRQPLAEQMKTSILDKVLKQSEKVQRKKIVEKFSLNLDSARANQRKDIFHKPSTNRQSSVCESCQRLKTDYKRKY